jgi:hypothetical protein
MIDPVPTMLLPRSRYDEGVEPSRGYLATVPHGDPQDDVMMGPLISGRQHKRVLGHIDTGVREGATPVGGGGRPKDPPKGSFVVPTTSADVDNPTAISSSVSGVAQRPMPRSDVASLGTWSPAAGANDPRGSNPCS